MTEPYTKAQDSIVCPYCGFSHPDSWEYVKDGDTNTQDFECEKCMKVFAMAPDFSVTFSTFKKGA